MPFNPYTDPNRPAREAAQRAADEARRSSQRFQEQSRQMAENARKTAEKFARGSAEANRRMAEQRTRLGQRQQPQQPSFGEVGGKHWQSRGLEPDTGRRRGGLFGFLVVIGLIVLGAYLLSVM